MTTRLSDIIYSEELTSYINQQAIASNRFVQSGILVPNATLNGFLSGQGELFSIPHWNALTGTPNASSTNNASSATPNDFSTGKQTARRLSYNNGWSSADLTAAVAGDDPLRNVGDKFAEYWNEQLNKIVVNSALGILADNDANDSDDMFTSVATDDSGAASASEKLSGNVVIDAMQTLGDAKDKVQAIAMHSVPHANLQKLGLLVDNFDPQTGQVMYQSYLGKRVIVDDAMPAVAGSNRITYTSVLFGAGAFQLGVGAPKLPQEVDRAPAQGDGGGVETIWTRRQWIVHPTGFQWSDGSVAGESPTLAELALAANWDRSFSRKNVPLAFIRSNG